MLGAGGRGRGGGQYVIISSHIYVRVPPTTRRVVLNLEHVQGPAISLGRAVEIAAAATVPSGEREKKKKNIYTHRSTTPAPEVLIIHTSFTRFASTAVHFIVSAIFYTLTHIYIYLFIITHGILARARARMCVCI